MRLLLIIVVILAVLVGAGFLVAGRMNQPQPPTKVRTEPVERGELIEFISAPGEVQARTKVSISAKTAAQIVELPYKEGERVTRGNASSDPPVEPSVLVKLDDTDLQARLRAVQAGRAAREAQLAVAEAQLNAGRARLAVNQVLLADAEAELDRLRKLYETADVSRRALEDAETRVNQLRAQVRAEELALVAEEANLEVLAFQIEVGDAEIEQAKEALTYSVIRSPIDGVVTRLNAEVGEIVVTGTMNNPGTVIMEVADLSEMIVKARVDETDVASVEVGQPARVRAAAYGDRELRGTVRSVSLSNEQRAPGMGGGDDSGRIYTCEILLDPEETAQVRVFSGLTADVEIETRHHTNVLRVPTQAVLTRRVEDLPAEVRSLPEVRRDREFTPVVYVLEDGKAKARPVVVGPSDLRMTLITAGIEEGDALITGPYKVLEDIRHGQEVKPEE